MSGIQSTSNEIFQKLIQANHILHYHDVVDAYGHISVRNPHNPDTFFMSREQAPALVSCREDIEEYHVSDASPVNRHAAKGYVERFIHSEIFKRYRGVQAVVHAHAEAILPFTITGIPLRPVTNLFASMGAQAPVFDIADHYIETDEQHHLLVDNEHLGADLAAYFDSTGAASRGVSTAKVELPPQPSVDGPDVPTHQTVLMRGHGFSCVAGTIEEAVYRAVYICSNARVQTTALQMHSSYNHGNPGNSPLKGIYYLTDREIQDTKAIHSGSRGRPWKLWCEEVANNTLYKNQFLESSSERLASGVSST